MLVLALGALETERNLLRGLRLEGQPGSCQSRRATSGSEPRTNISPQPRITEQKRSRRAPSHKKPVRLARSRAHAHLLVEDGLGLTTITGLLPVVTSLTYVFQMIPQGRDSGRFPIPGDKSRRRLGAQARSAGVASAP